MPNPPALRDKTAQHFHAVRFYKDADTLSGIVADFMYKGLLLEEPCVVIATPRHRVKVEQRLRERAVNVDQLREQGAVTLLDAETLLAQFMVEGMPDPVRFREAIVPLLEKATASRSGVSIRAYGEMVDVLWKAGQTVAAVRLEILWNSLAGAHDFALLCGYAMGNFYQDAAIEEICSHHSHVLSVAGESAAVW